ncbi:chemotaxis protein CheX [Cohnella sp. GbtcB17]|uniref:chemotaxis protein CheX n=1 Tax=Cohnella sp. GbtcB17 TaxID=2824762 RepID=UPI0020C5E123|nr:chemotaxis protein CheX [Cohnella sp. GbtcB17]
MNIKSNMSAIEKSGAEERSDELLQDILQALRQIVPLPLTVADPRAEDEEWQEEWGVLIGVTGDMYGRVVILGEGDVFGHLGETMFGMRLAGEMLHSFVGELANMVAGQAATLVAGRGCRIDITPPTVIAGRMHIYGLNNVVRMSVAFEGAGALQFIISRDTEGKV